MLTFAKNSNLKTGLYTIRRQIKTSFKTTKRITPKKSSPKLLTCCSFFSLVSIYAVRMGQQMVLDIM